MDYSLQRAALETRISNAYANANFGKAAGNVDDYLGTAITSMEEIITENYPRVQNADILAKRFIAECLENRSSDEEIMRLYRAVHSDEYGPKLADFAVNATVSFPQFPLPRIYVSFKSIRPEISMSSLLSMLSSKERMQIQGSGYRNDPLEHSQAIDDALKRLEQYRELN
jgi:hypothetical protein